MTCNSAVKWCAYDDVYDFSLFAKKIFRVFNTSKIHFLILVMIYNVKYAIMYTIYTVLRCLIVLIENNEMRQTWETIVECETFSSVMPKPGKFELNMGKREMSPTNVLYVGYERFLFSWNTPHISVVSKRCRLDHFSNW